MIFDNMINESAVDDSNIQPSKYELGLEGALMHVYENECNYNAMMKAVGLSELKYYTETGKELFLNEAGAFGSFLEKAKEFFKKVIEKIKAIFKKFFMAINAQFMDNKKFVTKYEKELNRKNLSDFEVEGYLFKDIDKALSTLLNGGSDYQKVVGELDTIKLDVNSFKYTDMAVANQTYQTTDADGNEEDKVLKLYYKDTDELNDAKETYRANLIGKTGQMDESEFKDELKEMIYGDKETIEIKSLRPYLEIIRTSDKTIRDVNKAKDKIVGGIDKVIRALDKKIKEFSKYEQEEKQSYIGNDPAKRAAAEAMGKEKRHAIENTNSIIDLLKSISNDYTIAFGMVAKGYNDRTKQAKSFCVKAINYKPKYESVYYSSYSEGGLFDSVVIK